MIKQSAALSWDEKLGVCQQWQAIGLSISKFCKQKKLQYLYSKVDVRAYGRLSVNAIPSIWL